MDRYPWTSYLQSISVGSATSSCGTTTCQGRRHLVEQFRGRPSQMKSEGVGFVVRLGAQDSVIRVSLPPIRFAKCVMG